MTSSQSDAFEIRLVRDTRASCRLMIELVQYLYLSVTLKSFPNFLSDTRSKRATRSQPRWFAIAASKIRVLHWSHTDRRYSDSAWIWAAGVGWAWSQEQ
jgi:hypothetical protein